LKIKSIFFVSLLVLWSLFTNNIYAQKYLQYELALTPSVSTTPFYGFAFGADCRLEKYLNSSNTFTLSSGIVHFLKTVKAEDYTVVPLKVGIKNNLSKNLYACLEMGVGIGVGLAENTGTGFVWSPSIGYIFKNTDISLQYQDFVKYISTKQFGIRFAYFIKH
jgi:hypothetical protein